jgi:hypothetical protein
MTEVSPKHTESPSRDVRLHSRTHVFVLATLYSDAGSGAVHVRNMSSTGALIEGSDLPKSGTSIHLKRGSLRITGRIVWVDGRKAGLAFSSAVYVADWMSRQPSLHQQRVDDAVRTVKLGTALRLSTEIEPIVASQCSVRDELEKLKSELATLENGLIQDPMLVASHPEIQSLDISLQRIDRILSELDR